MSGVWRLMRRDVRHATRNTMAVIVLVGLVVIPSLFTWFNVIASWDPFANTKELKVAVANSDAGYQSDLIPLKVNIGDQVVAALRANDDFAWVVTDEDDAIDGTESGEYYAAIVLPAEFSQDMLTFYADGGQRTDITYYTNEKKNALAPKITGQGADMVSSDINHVFTQTLGEIGVNLLTELSQYLSDADTQVTLIQLESHAGEVSSQLRAAATNATVFASLFDSSTTLVTSAAALVDGTSGVLDDTSSVVGQTIGDAGTLQTTIDSAASTLRDAIADSVASYTTLGDQIATAFAAAGTQAQSQAAVLDDLATQVEHSADAYRTLRETLVNEVRPTLPDAASQEALDVVVSGIDDAIARQETLQSTLESTAQAIRDGQLDAETARGKMDQALADAQAAVSQLQQEYNTNLHSNLVSLAQTLTAGLDAADTVRADLTSAAAALTGGAASISAKLQGASALMTQLAQQLNGAADTFDALAAALQEARTSGNFSAIQGALGTDPDQLAQSLAAPVSLNRVAVFPVATFGSAMAPLYSVLALWVGALLLSVTIKVAVPRAAVPVELTATQKYFGRYGIFALVGLAQSTLLGVGNLVFVGVQAVHPMLYLVTGWVASMVFTFSIYTFVVAFGNAGKAVGVLLLVVQISGAGAAYPLEVLPQWFQHVNRFLPATYAVDAYRAAIAGIYQGDYMRAIGMLLLFALPVAALGVWLRRPLITFNQNIAAALESTKLM